MDRRNFFKNSFAEGILKLSHGIFNSIDEIKGVLAHYYQPADLTDFDIFFLSNSYAATLAKTSVEELTIQAKKLGIEPGNKSKVELIRAIFESTEEEKGGDVAGENTAAGALTLYKERSIEHE